MDYLDKLNKLLEKYTQEELAEMLTVSHRSIQNYLSKASTPHQKTVRLIDETYEKLFGKPSFIEQRRGQKISQSGPDLVPFVPVKAQAGYVKAVDQELYLENLEKYALPPGVSGRGTIWRYWEVEGDSMEPVFVAGDIVLTSYVHPMDWENIRNFYVYVIVTDERVLIKRVYCKNSLEWVLISENEDHYPQQLLSIDYIKEVWVYRKTWGTKASPTKEFEIKV